MSQGQIWIPKGTELLSNEGWTKIEYLYNKGGAIMTVNLDKRKVERQKVSNLQQRQSGQLGQSVNKINEIRTEFTLIRFQSGVLIPKKEVFDGFDELPSISHDFKQVGYSGMLYSFQVPNGVAILRNTFKGINITTKVDLEEGLFTQDEYEDGGEYGYLDKLEVDASLECRWAKHKERPQKDISPVMPDYWMSRTRW